MPAKKKAAVTAERKKRESTVPADETKRAKFSRLATHRVSKAVKAIQQIGNLSGSIYEYGEDDVAKIAKLLRETSDTTLSRFKTKTKSDAPVIVFE